MGRCLWIILAAGGCVPHGPPPVTVVMDATVSAPEDATIKDAAVVQDAAPPTEDAATVPDVGIDAGTPPLPDAGPVVDAGPPAELQCDGPTLRDRTGMAVATYQDAGVCAEVLAARGEGVVCAFFQTGDPIGPGGWDETGWRAMNWRTGIGLGRRPHESYAACLDATQNARGGVVCTNTGVGYKSAHIETNMWCGSSSGFSYCLQASAAARNFWVCSFPSDGDGSGAGWNLTHIDGTTCDYTTGGLTLDACNAMVP